MMDYLRYIATRFAGYCGSKKIPGLTKPFIRYFCRAYQVNMQEAAQSDLNQYQTFNGFFTRALKTGIRPVDQKANSLVSPADGFISQVGNIDDNKLIQAKGHDYTLEALLGGEAQAQPFKHGFYSTIYLSPKDYHRIHMPLKASCYQATYIPGKLYPVKLSTAASVNNLFAKNERVVCYFDTDFGKMAMVLVGATIVGSIELAWQGIINPTHQGEVTTWQYEQPIQLEKGQEMGRFNIGSTVILLCENKMPDHWQQQPSLKEQSIQYGQTLAEYLNLI